MAPWKPIMCWPVNLFYPKSGWHYVCHRSSNNSLSADHYPMMACATILPLESNKFMYKPHFWKHRRINLDTIEIENKIWLSFEIRGLIWVFLICFELGRYFVLGPDTLAIKIALSLWASLPPSTALHYCVRLSATIENSSLMLLSTFEPKNDLSSKCIAL